MTTPKPGLYANIHAKQERIAHGSGETMRKPGDKGAPTAENFEGAAETEKPTGKKTAVGKTSGKSAARKTGSDKPRDGKASAKNSPATKAASKASAGKAASR